MTNASPLIFLTKIDSLGLLQRCFSRVLVPPGVVVETGLDLTDFVEQSRFSDLGDAFVRGALGSLHRGELETLLLARERDIDLVAVDDSAARRKAVQMGLRPIGTVGILVLARRFGHLDEPTALEKLDRLVDRHVLYLSSAIIGQVRRALARSRPDATEEQ